MFKEELGGGRGEVVQRGSSATARYIGFADLYIADQFWPIRGFQNSITANLRYKITDHGAHFATERTPRFWWWQNNGELTGPGGG